MKNKYNIEKILSYILRVGLFLAILVAVVGAVLLIYQNGSHAYNFSAFQGEPKELTDIHLLVKEAIHFNLSPLALIQLGLLILIATPVCRVLVGFLLFLSQKDYLYTALSAIVLSILLYGLFIS